MLREYPDVVEADLSRFYGIDYRDRWRFADNGMRCLTLRMIHVRVKHLPPESALQSVFRRGRIEWRLEHVLLAQIWQASVRSEKPHPLLKAEMRALSADGRSVSVDRSRKLHDARRRARQRRHAIETGLIS